MPISILLVRQIREMVRTLRLFIVASSLFYLGLHSSASGDNTYFIDAHSQVDDEVELNTIE